MSTTTLDPKAEDVQAIADTPNWTESFHGSGYDPQSGIGFFVHIARASIDTRLWDETFVAFLPDDRFLVSRGYAYGDTPQGPSANAVRYVHTEPWKAWEVGFDGAARLVDGNELAASTVTDDSHVKAVAALRMHAIGQPLFVGGGDEFWSSFHSEQHIAFEGELEWEGRRVTLKGTGLRDHSVGPRDINALEQHTWCHGEFPSGRLFMVMDVDSIDGTSLQHAVLGDADGFADATITEPGGTFLATPKHAWDDYEVTLDGPDGPTTIKAEILQVLPLSLRGINDWVPGTRQDAHHLMYECQTRFTWDGEVGYGLTERSVAL